MKIILKVYMKLRKILFKYYCCRSQLTLKLLFNGPDKP